MDIYKYQGIYIYISQKYGFKFPSFFTQTAPHITLLHIHYSVPCTKHSRHLLHSKGRTVIWAETDIWIVVEVFRIHCDHIITIEHNVSCLGTAGYIHTNRNICKKVDNVCKGQCWNHENQIQTNTLTNTSINTWTSALMNQG